MFEICESTSALSVYLQHFFLLKERVLSTRNDKWKRVFMFTATVEQNFKISRVEKMVEIFLFEAVVSFVNSSWVVKRR